MANLVIYPILFEHFGEDANEPYMPKRGYVEAVDKELLEVTIERYKIYPTSQIPIVINKYKVKDVTMPEWYTPEEYCANRAVFNSFFSCISMDYEEEWAVKLYNLYKDDIISFNLLYAIGKLIKTKSFKSDFRKSLYKQLIEWLKAGTGYREPSRFQIPFSPLQSFKLMDEWTLKEAKSLKSKLDGSLSYYERVNYG